MINRVLVLIKDDFLNNKIKINVNEEKAFNIVGVENEFKHLILNLLNNSKDAFNDNEIPFNKRVIDINIIGNTKAGIIEVIDNAGGIPKEIFDTIFNTNVTSKKKGKGNGIGLYLSSQIARKYNGVLKVENIENGAKFIYEQRA